MVRTNKFKSGSLWWVELTKNPSDSVGHEQAKARSRVLIVTNQFAKMTTVIPLTENLNAARFSHTYIIDRTQGNGLKQKSVALIFQLRSLSYKRFKQKLGILHKNDIKMILKLIKNYFRIS